MATGRLGSAALGATTNTTVYTVPASTIASFTIRACNRTAGDIALRLALAASATPNNSEYIEYDVTIPANGVLEEGGIVLDAAKQVVAYADATGLSINVYGYEEDV